MGNQLSGGEQQMLAIGRALMTNPKLLILDEATEGLAPLIRAEIWACLARLKNEGQAILLVDKHLDALTRIADRHVVIEKGHVVWTRHVGGARGGCEREGEVFAGVADARRWRVAYSAACFQPAAAWPFGLALSLQLRSGRRGRARSCGRSGRARRDIAAGNGCRSRRTRPRPSW